MESFGPPPLAEMTKKFFELNAFDIDIRIRDEGKPDPRPMLVPHEIELAGIVMQDENVKVSCVLADHPPLPVALSYRFDTADRSIVFSDPKDRRSHRSCERRGRIRVRGAISSRDASGARWSCESRQVR